MAKGRHKTMEGVVVSDKSDKTVVVMVETRKPHPLYRRIIRRRKKYKAHDEGNLCVVGDLVQIIESRPISKEKRWRVAAILGRGQVASEEFQPKDEIEPGLEEPIVTVSQTASIPHPEPETTVEDEDGDEEEKGRE